MDFGFNQATKSGFCACGDVFRKLNDNHFFLSDSVLGNIDGAKVATHVADYFEGMTFDEDSDYCNLLKAAETKMISAPLQGETTALVFNLNHSWIRGAGLGDTEIVILRGDTVIDLTYDIPRKPRLGGFQSEPQYFSERLKHGDVVIAGTDGLFSMLDMSVIIPIARQSLPSSIISRQLVERSAHNGSYLDDVSVVVFKESGV